MFACPAAIEALRWTPDAARDGALRGLVGYIRQRVRSAGEAQPGSGGEERETRRNGFPDACNASVSPFPSVDLVTAAYLCETGCLRTVVEAKGWAQGDRASRCARSARGRAKHWQTTLRLSKGWTKPDRPGRAGELARKTFVAVEEAQQSRCCQAMPRRVRIFLRMALLERNGPAVAVRGCRQASSSRAGGGSVLDNASSCWRAGPYKQDP